MMGQFLFRTGAETQGFKGGWGSGLLGLKEEKAGDPWVLNKRSLGQGLPS